MRRGLLRPTGPVGQGVGVGNLPCPGLCAPLPGPGMGDGPPPTAHSCPCPQKLEEQDRRALSIKEQLQREHRFLKRRLEQLSMQSLERVRTDSTGSAVSTDDSEQGGDVGAASWGGGGGKLGGCGWLGGGLGEGREDSRYPGEPWECVADVLGQGR